MEQERKRYLSCREKFEDGVLRVDACSDRYLTPRRFQYRTRSEDLPSYSFGSRELREEAALIRDAHQFIASGFKIQASESVEDFVVRCGDSAEKEAV